MNKLVLIMVLLVGCSNTDMVDDVKDAKHSNRQSIECGPSYDMQPDVVASTSSEIYTFQSGEVGILAKVKILPSHHVRSNQNIEIVASVRVYNDYFIAGATLYEPHLDGLRELEWEVEQNGMRQSQSVMAILPNIRESLAYEVHIRLHPKKKGQIPAYEDPYCHILLHSDDCQVGPK